MCVQHGKTRADKGAWESVGRVIEGYFEGPVLQGVGF